MVEVLPQQQKPSVLCTPVTKKTDARDCDRLLHLKKGYDPHCKSQNTVFRDPTASLASQVREMSLEGHGMLGNATFEASD